MPPVNNRIIIFLVALCLCSCGEKEDVGNRKQTYPVTGTLLVDGSPAEDVQVTCHDVNGLDKENPTTSASNTDSDGTFKISTYKAGDGVPAGEYVLTFFWGQTNVFTREYVGPDKLNDRYRDPKKAEVKFKVETGKPTDLGDIELTTK
jgi:5-hydroxyisourate hydrolase-like protein (transthyretin family)